MARALTKRAYAKHREEKYGSCSESAVRKAVKTGRISTRPDGKIDPAVADRQWARNTDPTKPLNQITGNPRHRKPSPDAPSEPMDLGERNGKNKDPLSGYSKARAMREAYKALREKIMWELDSKKTVEVERIRAAAATAGKITCDRIMAQPARLARVLAGVTDPARCRKILQDDARRTCEDLLRSLEKASRGER